MSLARALLAAPLLCVLAACGSASGASNDSAAVEPVHSNGTIVAPVVTDPSGFKLGTNLSTVQYWDGSRPLSNLIYGSGWQMQGPGGAEDVPVSSLDANGWVKALPAGYRVLRVLSIPSVSADMVCKYQGNGTVNVTGGSDGLVTNVTFAPGETRFHYNSSYPSVTWAYLWFNVDPSNYIRNIDCRETGASTTATIAPEMLSSLNGFKVIRFMKWQAGVEGNGPVSWATRNKPGDGDYVRSDGVPVEVMVDLATQAGANPWFAMPWNADDDYITRFATYVRDNLPADRQVYVETSNEVWNWVYPVTSQAAREGAAAGLPSDIGGNGQQMLERYAEKTQHVMQIWSNVFSGQSSRLVRVAAFQNVQPFWVDYIMNYNNTANYVDAVATAPYFGINYDTDFPGYTVDQLFATAIPAKITETLNFAVQNKQIAAKYGKRFVTYEAGQHILMGSNVTLQQQLQRDPRMYDMYKNYITGWQTKVGDTMTLFALAGPISQFGAWGMLEYVGQPLAQAPKMRAVHDILAGTTTAAADPPITTPTTQVCPDGTIILSTSTCPVPSTPTPSGPTKKKGGGRGPTKFA